jgi:hypothetical protein
MPRKVSLVIVCEDILHETFVRAFLYRRGFSAHQLTFRKPPAASGDAKKNACSLFHRELQAIRRFSGSGRGLILILDADNMSPRDRKRWIDESCADNSTPRAAENEPVFTIIPKWEVENWLAHLGGEAVDEQLNTYDKYRGHESDIYPLVERLAEMCEQGEMPDAPPSLAEACGVYARFDRWRSRG